MNQSPQAPLQPVPEKIKLEIVDEMEIEILVVSQNDFYFQSESQVAISIRNPRKLTKVEKDFEFDKSTIEDIDLHLEKHFDNHDRASIPYQVSGSCVRVCVYGAWGLL